MQFNDTQSNSNFDDFPILPKKVKSKPTTTGKPTTYNTIPTNSTSLDNIIDLLQSPPSSTTPHKTSHKSSSPSRRDNNTNHSSSREEDEKIKKEWEFMHALPKDISSLAIMVDDPRTFGAATAVAAVIAADLNGHIRFKISRWLPKDASTSPKFVRRRHRDFMALSLRLGVCFPHVVFPGLLLPSSSPSTSKVWSSLKTSSVEEDFLTVRAHRLEAYLSTLLEKFPEICAHSVDVHSFLLKDSESFDEIATKYLNNKGRGLEVPAPNLSESLQGWMTSATTRFTGSALEPKNVEKQGELACAFEALMSYVEESSSVVKDRSLTFERLVHDMERIAFLLRQRHELNDKLLTEHFKVSLAGQVEVDTGLVRRKYSPPDTTEGNSPLQKQQQQREGPIRSLHRLCAQLNGARECFTNNMLELQQPTGSRVVDVQGIADQFAILRKQCLSTTREVMLEFGRVSLEQARNERLRLETLRDELLRKRD